MSQIRKAHTIEIIDRRLAQLETSGELDAMELVGMHDELSRVERKRLEKAKDLAAGIAGKRPPANLEEHNTRFERLTRLVEAALRKAGADSPERQYLKRVCEALHLRKPAES